MWYVTEEKRNNVFFMSEKVSSILTKYSKYLLRREFNITARIRTLRDAKSSVNRERSQKQLAAMKPITEIMCFEGINCYLAFFCSTKLFWHQTAPQVLPPWVPVVCGYPMLSGVVRATSCQKIPIF